MLQELSITDFAIIQQVRLHFTDGLIIFTGETGAGKSIVLDAIGALLGDRMSADVVRTGAPRAIIEGIFTLPWLPAQTAIVTAREGNVGDQTASSSEDSADEKPDPHLHVAELLHEFGIAEEDDSLIITREIAASGRSVARINGRTVPISVLARIGGLLVDVHGQGAHLALLRPEQHVDYLDRAAELLPQRQHIRTVVLNWQAKKRELLSLRRDERELERRAELLRYQVDEITKSQLQPKELETLEQERTRLGNVERLRELSETAYLAMTGDSDNDVAGAIDLLATVERSLSELSRMDESIVATQTALDEVRYQLEDITATIRDYRDNLEADPERLVEVEDRFDKLQRLRRKYGATIEDILSYGQEAAAELEQIDTRDERIAALESAIEQQRIALGQSAEALSERRHESAVLLSTAMEAALHTLNMRHARFFIQMQRQPSDDGVFLHDNSQVAITSTGIDRVEFLIAPNPGEQPKPLARIASGGETARLMLALKTILAKADATPTLIFDEVDAGISGITGQIVGEMLWNLARQHQVICVTHLPQMAAFGDQHWHVAKRIIDDRTSTVVTELDAAARTLEVAQMLGGVATESAARNAAELLDRAAVWKDQSKNEKNEEVSTSNGNGHIHENGHATPKKSVRRKQGSGA